MNRNANNVSQMIENVINIAFFLNPFGELIRVKGANHVSAIIQSPETFGLTREELEAIYNKYHEPLGQEGKAREEILTNLVRAGWMRMRRYPNKFWSINLFKLTVKAKDLLYDWANNILKGTWGFKETDPYMPVKVDFVGGQISKYTVKDVASDKLFNEEVTTVAETIYDISPSRERAKIIFLR
jgi:hypothetical protein